LSFDGLSILVVFLLEGLAAGAGVVEENDVHSVSSSILVKSAFKNVKQGFSVVVGEGRCTP
jgi:hypothetical protein